MSESEQTAEMAMLRLRAMRGTLQMFTAQLREVPRDLAHACGLPTPKAVETWRFNVDAKVAEFVEAEKAAKAAAEAAAAAAPPPETAA